jgi:hypothetical protein
MEYLVTEFNLDIMREGLQFWKYNTKIMSLNEHLEHILNKTYVSQK